MKSLGKVKAPLWLAQTEWDEKTECSIHCLLPSGEYAYKNHHMLSQNIQVLL